MAPPPNRRRKVGLMRIDAALASMRPMGFPDDVVRKSVKDLLKVYGEDGWFFIEEASYKLLIETILEGQQLAEEEEEEEEEGGGGGGGGDDAGGSGEKSGSVQELCDKEDCCKEEKGPQVVCQTEIDDDKHEGKKIQVDNHFISKDDSQQAQLGLQLDFAPRFSPMIVDRVPTIRTHKPSCGWLSADDEDDEFLLLPPANGANPK